MRGDLVMMPRWSLVETQQDLEHAARDAEAAFRGLVGIGGGADDDGGLADTRRVERPHEHAGEVALDQDVSLERIHGWLREQRAIRVGAQVAARRVTLDGVAMRVASVAVAAAELAADVGVDATRIPCGSRRRC